MTRSRRTPPLGFLAFATTVVALLHAYIGARLLPDSNWPAWAQHLALLWLLLSVLLIPCGLLARVIDRQRLADTLAWIGLLAMGFFSSLLVLCFVRDLALLPVALWLPPSATTLMVFTRSAQAVPALALLLTLIGFTNARRTPRVQEVELPIAGLAPALQGFTIVQLSDVHIGPTIKRRQLERVVARANSLAADVVAITGDLVDDSVARLHEHVAPLAALQARHGVYFVTGNHEYYAGVGPWLEALPRLGLRVLLNEHVVLEHQGARLLLAGVTDFNAGAIEPSHASSPAQALAGAPAEVRPRILLAHQPRSAVAAAAAGFDVQLSGHTHGGQFLPWNFFVRLQQPFTAGLNRYGQLLVYTSRGTGYWGPPKRLGAPAEITRLRLVAAG